MPAQPPSRELRLAQSAAIVVVYKPPAPPPPSAPAPPRHPGSESERISATLAQRRVVAYDEHHHTLDAVRRALADLGLDAAFAAIPDASSLSTASLVITVGGDGTFLFAARHTQRAPMLGVNSSPSTSVGHYCGATAADVRERIADCLAGRDLVSLSRIQAAVDGAPVGEPVLNDVLFANVSPAGSTRYALGVDGAFEIQLSSGVWIATASGSSAAILSAGGTVMATEDTRLQYVVREPCRPVARRLGLLSGFCDTVDLRSRTDDNALFLDGRPDRVPLRRGQVARLERSEVPLTVCRYRGVASE